MIIYPKKIYKLYIFKSIIIILKSKKNVLKIFLKYFEKKIFHFLVFQFSNIFNNFFFTLSFF
jgi:hypothetical protein